MKEIIIYYRGSIMKYKLQIPWEVLNWFCGDNAVLKDVVEIVDEDLDIQDCMIGQIFAESSGLTEY